MENEIVTHDVWIAKRKELLRREKEFTRMRDDLSRKRRELPWECIDKHYVFDGPNGKETLSGLFEGRSQLIVYHFMFGPDWEEGCPTCSLVSDNINPNVTHLAQRDVTVAVVSRAPFAKIEAFKKRMGWKFKWLSSFNNDFNRDFQVSFTKAEVAEGSMYYNYGPNPYPADEAHGVSVFYKNETGEIFHTYSTYARGPEPLLGVYNFLDLVPRGRDEDDLPYPMAWIRHHDRYRNEENAAESCCACEEARS
jgi:predicted dithiol-disulfide oxidoreductase (DUF899 family)